MCRVITLFLLGQQYRSGGPFRYSEHVFKDHRKCFRGIWKKFSAQNTRFCQKIPTPDLTFVSSSCFELKLFSNTSKTFSVDFKNMFGVSGRSAWPILLPKYKKRDHMTHQSDYMLGKVKKVEIFKKWSLKWGWNILTKPHVLSWNFVFNVAKFRVSNFWWSYKKIDRFIRSR